MSAGSVAKYVAAESLPGRWPMPPVPAYDNVRVLIARGYAVDSVSSRLRRHFRKRTRQFLLILVHGIDLAPRQAHIEQDSD